MDQEERGKMQALACMDSTRLVWWAIPRRKFERGLGLLCTRTGKLGPEGWHSTDRMARNKRWGAADKDGEAQPRRMFTQGPGNLFCSICV